MALVMSDKNTDRAPAYMEQQLNRLRFAMKEIRDSDAKEYKREDRKHNATSMRRLWNIVQTGEVLADFSQRAFFALCAGAIPARAQIVNPKGEVYDVSLSLDNTRSYQYRAAKYQTVPYTNQFLKDRKKTLAENEYELWRLQQFCEATIQSKANEAVVQIHSVKLMVAWHRDSKSKSISRVRGINIDDTYNTFDRERPNYRRRHLALPASKISLETMQRRAGAFCDSARIVGERSVLQDSYIGKPRPNAALAIMSEATIIVSEAYDKLMYFTNCILRDMGQYKGFGKADNVIQPEALTMRYVDGVTIYSGRHATSVYTHEQVKYDVVRRMVAAGAMTLDVPRFSFFAPHERDDAAGRIPKDKADTIWKVGREFLSKSLDIDVRQTLRGYSKVAATRNSPVTK